jgi:PAS domain S-box-containing protein
VSALLKARLDVPITLPMADVVGADPGLGVGLGRRALEVDAIVAQLLDLARTRTGMDVAWVARDRDGQLVFEHLGGASEAFGLARGSSRALADSYCGHLLDGRLPNLVTDARRDPATRDLAMTRALGLGAFIGVPILGADTTPLGVLACAHRAAVYDVGPAEVRFLELLAAATGELLGDDQIARERQRRLRDRVGIVLEPGRLTTAFQPIVDITTNRIVGAEALTRFPAEPREPDRWFADAQSVGLGTALELAAVRQAFSDFARLPPAVYLGVNASPQLLCNPEFHALVAELPGDRLVIELTEHAAVADYEELLQSIDLLRARRVRFAVDDVGAGFASFSHVLRVRPDILKIDVSITRGIDQDPARRGLARAIVDLAREIGATVVAEGIERQAELDRVGAIGVDAVQGFFIGRPRPLPMVTRVPRAAAPAPAADPRVEGEQDARRLAETRFELALLHSPIGIAIVGLDGAFLHTNPALDQILGYSAVQLRERTFQDITHPDDLAPDLELVEQCLAGTRDGYQMRKRYRHADGRMIPSLLSVVLVRNADGRPLYFISQIQPEGPGSRDRAARRADRRARRDRTPLEPDASAGPSIDELEDAFVFHRADGTIGAWNRAAARLLGWRARDVVGRHVSLIVPPEGLDDLQGMLRRAADGERTDRLAVCKHRDGRRVAVVIAAAPVRDVQDRICGASTSIRELRDQDVVLGAVVEAEIRLRSPHELGSEAVLVTTERGIVKFASDSVGAVLGYAPATLMDQDLTEYVHPDDLERTVLDFDEAISHPNHPRTVEHRVRDASGSWLPAETTIVSLLEHPVIDGVALRVRRRPGPA